MEAATTGLRRLPLRAAGAISVVTSLFYLAGIFAQDDRAFFPQALFWFAVMIVAGGAAWIADQSPRHGRNLAKGAAVAFFVLGLISNLVLAAAFVAALVLAVAGFAGTSRPPIDQSGEGGR